MSQGLRSSDRLSKWSSDTLTGKTSSGLTAFARGVRTNAIQLEKGIVADEQRLKQALKRAAEEENKFMQEEESMRRKNKNWVRQAEFQIQQKEQELNDKLADIEKQKRKLVADYTEALEKMREATIKNKEKFERLLVARREQYLLQCYQGTCDEGQKLIEKINQSKSELVKVKEWLGSMGDLGDKVSYNDAVRYKNAQVEALTRELGGTLSL